MKLPEQTSLGSDSGPFEFLIFIAIPEPSWNCPLPLWQSGGWRLLHFKLEPWRLCHHKEHGWSCDMSGRGLDVCKCNLVNCLFSYESLYWNGRQQHYFLCFLIIYKHILIFEYIFFFSLTTTCLYFSFLSIIKVNKNSRLWFLCKRLKFLFSCRTEDEENEGSSGETLLLSSSGTTRKLQFSPHI